MKVLEETVEFWRDWDEAALIYQPGPWSLSAPFVGIGRALNTLVAPNLAAGCSVDGPSAYFYSEIRNLPRMISGTTLTICNLLSRHVCNLCPQRILQLPQGRICL
ncbi:hypothetical protein AG1IA_05805 [Rhizoctonia solani AG-1 IA]|uniref:Uncharacterized protein n=1 Tax=Thanatephorus cucumeris (strain AG1-IA) TaxID=983506 RepID=L8WQ80_THACA|nr:hypothetical protein AG1IA_05805 [Rhizoctonia solani AG-1 IA]